MMINHYHLSTSSKSTSGRALVKSSLQNDKVHVHPTNTPHLNRSDKRTRLQGQTTTHRRLPPHHPHVQQSPSPRQEPQHCPAVGRLLRPCFPSRDHGWLALPPPVLTIIQLGARNTQSLGCQGISAHMRRGASSLAGWSVRIWGRHQSELPPTTPRTTSSLNLTAHVSVPRK